MTAPRAPQPPAPHIAWWRLWTVQGSFEPAGQQWSGWLVCLAPWLRQALDETARREWLASEPKTLNTNPYLFGLLVGTRQRVEEEHGAGVARRLTQGLQSALGALGDGLFWSSWRPTAALLAAWCGLFGEVVGVVAVWLSFALAQAWLRIGMLRWGYAHGAGVVEELAGLGLQSWTRRGRVLGAGLAGALGAWLVGSLVAGPDAWRGIESGAAALVVVGGAFLALRRMRGEVAILWAAAVVWILARTAAVTG